MGFQDNIKCLILFVVVTLITAQTEPNCTTEEYRPRYHFSPARNWMNDPNGMVYYNGTYHLFFQYHPYDTNWGPMHWGHAISSDMATWEELEIALYPDDLGTIFSGSAVVDYGNTTGFQTDPNIDTIVAMFTHAGDQQRQSIAYSNDGGFTFTKYEGNPVIDNPGIADFRDPKVIRYEDKWVMVLAVWNHIDFYTSDDMKVWTKTSGFGQDPEQGHHGGTWECPDFVKLSVDYGNGTRGEKWVLLISTFNHPNRGSGIHYLVGSFNGTHFTSSGWDSNQWVDWGWDNYAGQTFSNDPKNRTVFMGWMANGAYIGSVPTGSWRGQMTLPRELGLRHVTGDGSQGEHYRLTVNPVEELQNLRKVDDIIHWNGSIELPRGTGMDFAGGFSEPNTMELEVILEMIGDPTFTLCGENGGDDFVCLTYGNSTWSLDRSATLNTGFNGEFQQMLVAQAPRETDSTIVKIKVFLDVSTFEVFLDDGLVAMTAQYFPTRPLDNFAILHVDDGRFAELYLRTMTLRGLNCWHE